MKAPKLTSSIVVLDRQMGPCAAVVIGFQEGGLLNAAGWTPQGSTRLYYGIKHRDAPRSAIDALSENTWIWPDELEK